MSFSPSIITLEEAHAEANPWPEPVPFTRTAPPSLDFSTGIPSTLPKLRAFAAAQAEALQVSPDAVALLAVGLASLAASRTFEMEPQPGWRETAPLWTVFLADPGERKSALLSALAEPVHRWQSAERDSLKHALACYAEQRRGLDARLASVRKKRAGAKPGETKQFEEESADLARMLEDMPELSAPVLITANATPEAARDALATNGEKLAIVSAEVDAGQLMGSRYAKDGGANVDLFLSAWIGESCSALRVGRRIPLDRPALAMILAVQPTAVRDVLRDAVAQGRGLVDRFLFIQPPSRIGYREMQPPPVPEDLAEWWGKTICRVLTLPWPGRVILNADGPARSEAAPHIIRPSAEAAACLLRLRRDIEARCRPEADLAPLAGFASKLHGQVARIALAFHVLENPEALTMDAATMQAACAWTPFLIGHARAVRGDAVESATFRQARRLLDLIKRHNLKSATTRDLLRLVQGESVPTSEACAELIGELVERGYLRQSPANAEPKCGGRPPSQTYTVNPATHETP